MERQYTDLHYLCTGMFGKLAAESYTTLQQSQQLEQKSDINEIIYSPIMFFTKYAILLQYIRIFVPNHKSTMFYVIQSIIIIIGCFFTSSLFVSIFQCVPREKLWTPTLPGFCINYPVTLMVVGIFNVCSDFVILLLPMAWIWGLKMSTQRKLGVSSIFAFGAL